MCLTNFFNKKSKQGNRLDLKKANKFIINYFCIETNVQKDLLKKTILAKSALPKNVCTEILLAESKNKLKNK